MGNCGCSLDLHLGCFQARTHKNTSFQCYSSNDASGQASRTSLSVMGLPTNVTSSPRRCFVIAIAASSASRLGFPQDSPKPRGSVRRQFDVVQKQELQPEPRRSARCSSDLIPSAPANRVRETRCFSQTRTARVHLVTMWRAGGFKRPTIAGPILASMLAAYPSFRSCRQ